MQSKVSSFHTTKVWTQTLTATSETQMPPFSASKSIETNHSSFDFTAAIPNPKIAPSQSSGARKSVGTSKFVQ